jgi:hypothetical protein
LCLVWMMSAVLWWIHVATFCLWLRHILPSLSHNDVGFRKTMLLRDIPFCMCAMRMIQSWRSFFVSFGSLVIRWWCAFCSALRILLMKCLACGMMNPTWFSLPTSVASCWCCIGIGDLWADIFVMESVQALAFSIGSAIVSALVLIVQPR